MEITLEGVLRSMAASLATLQHVYHILSIISAQTTILHAHTIDTCVSHHVIWLAGRHMHLSYKISFKLQFYALMIQEEIGMVLKFRL